MYILRRPPTRERALLVLAVGGLHGERVGRQRRRQRLRDAAGSAPARRAPKLVLGISATAAHARAVAGRSPARPRRGLRAGSTTRCVRAWRSCCGAGRSGIRLEARLPPVASSVCPAAADDQTSLRRQLLAHALERERLGRARRRLGQRARPRARVLLARSLTSVSSVRAAEVQAGVERALDLDVEPALDGARDELVAHRVDQHARHDADQREDRRQLEQQPAAELAARRRAAAAAPRRCTITSSSSAATTTLTQNSQT